MRSISFLTSRLFSNMGMTGTLLYRQLGIMFSTLSTMIAVVLAFLILYANQFLLKRRKKELGVYMMHHGINPHETLISSTFKV